jgi:hypothetical protein
MMTWSINWDAITGCGKAYQYANNYERLFTNVTEASTVRLPCGTITIYPNPAHDLLHIRLTRTSPEPLSAQLYNTLGEMVLARPLTSTEETLNISDLPTGVYYLRIGTFCRMIIKY